MEAFHLVYPASPPTSICNLPTTKILPTLGTGLQWHDSDSLVLIRPSGNFSRPQSPAKIRHRISYSDISLLLDIPVSPCKGTMPGSSSHMEYSYFSTEDSQPPGFSAAPIFCPEGSGKVAEPQTSRHGLLCRLFLYAKILAGKRGQLPGVSKLE